MRRIPALTLLLAATLAVGGPAGSAVAKSEKAAEKAAEKAVSGGGKAKAATGSGATAAGATALGTAAAAAAGAALASALLSDHDRHAIAGYFQQYPQPAEAMPPGIAKNVARGKPLPPGIAKKGLPGALTSRLSIPSGYRLESVGTDVVLVSIATGVIADVLKDVLRN